MCRLLVLQRKPTLDRMLLNGPAQVSMKMYTIVSITLTGKYCSHKQSLRKRFRSTGAIFSNSAIILKLT